MHSPAVNDRPAPTTAELHAILAEMLLARDELIEMVELHGPLSVMRDKPRRYFVPEPGTNLPFTNGCLNNLLNPIYQVESDNDKERLRLAGEIVLYDQFFELVRREIIPERFVGGYHYGTFARLAQTGSFWADRRLAARLPPRIDQMV